MLFRASTTYAFQTINTNKQSGAFTVDLSDFPTKYAGVKLTYTNAGAFNAYGGNFLARWQPTEDLTFIGRIGGYWGEYSGLTSRFPDSFGAVLGAQARYALSKQLDVVVDYTHFTGAGIVTGVDAYQAGLAYKF